MSYTKKEDVLAIINELPRAWNKHCGISKMEYLKIRINNLPDADVAPVRHGRWEEDCAGAAVCSMCCEYAFETSTHHLCGWFPNYCPNCGALMDKEETE